MKNISVKISISLMTINESKEFDPFNYKFNK